MWTVAEYHGPSTAIVSGIRRTADNFSSTRCDERTPVGLSPMMVVGRSLTYPGSGSVSAPLESRCGLSCQHTLCLRLGPTLLRILAQLRKLDRDRALLLGKPRVH